MAASDYTGKEKTSLDNIKKMVADATSLEEIRGNMGLGRELSTLQAANGGTGVNNLQDVADAIVTAIGNIKSEINTKSAAFVCGSATNGGSTLKDTFFNCNLNYSIGSDLAASTSGITVKTAGVYRMYAFAMPKGSYYDARFFIKENQSKVYIPLLSCLAGVGGQQGFASTIINDSPNSFDLCLKAGASLQPVVSSGSGTFYAMLSVVKLN